MPSHPFTTFSPTNRRQILFLFAGHLLWSCALLGLGIAGRELTASPGWSVLFLVLQFHAATQLLLPTLQMHPEERTRSFYFFWGTLLGGGIWLINQLTPSDAWLPLLAALKSGLLLLTATVIGTALARYVRRLWEIIPVCVVMTLADFSSWRYGPTGEFAEEIRSYYLAPEGPPPLIDMILVKLALPGSASIVPVFGISDWIMVAFFVAVARRYEINDNLAGPPGHELARPSGFGRYLPVPGVALFVAVLLARTTGHFVPALPLIALVMLSWYAVRFLFRSSSSDD